MLNPRLEERELHDRIVQEWLILAHMDVDEQERPQPEAEEPRPEAEDPQPEGYGNAHESEAGPSTTLLEKLALKVYKLDTDMAQVLINQDMLYTF